MTSVIDKFGWLDEALCAQPGADPDLWFDAARRNEAAAICDRCPVSAQCDQRAEETEAYRGVWAGTSRAPDNTGASLTPYLPAERRRKPRPITVVDGRPWPGYAVKFCPVCNRQAGTRREPVSDERGELVLYHEHTDTSGKPCLMGGKRAAIRAVAFTGAETGVPA